MLLPLLLLPLLLLLLLLLALLVAALLALSVVHVLALSHLSSVRVYQASDLHRNADLWVLILVRILPNF